MNISNGAASPSTSSTLLEQELRCVNELLISKLALAEEQKQEQERAARATNSVLVATQPSALHTQQLRVVNILLAEKVDTLQLRRTAGRRQEEEENNNKYEVDASSSPLMLQQLRAANAMLNAKLGETSKLLRDASMQHRSTLSNNRQQHHHHQHEEEEEGEGSGAASPLMV
jgi:hypothetical protein